MLQGRISYHPKRKDKLHFLYPQFVAEAEINPSEILELEHCLKPIIPYGRDETQVYCTRVVLSNHINPIQNSMVLQPDWRPVDAKAGAINRIVG